jgi:hypothetical protein
MTTHDQSTASAAAPLETVLESMIAEHQRLLEAARRQRRAISEADAAAIAECIREQNRIVQRIASLERERAEAVRSAAMVGNDPAPTLAAFAAGLPWAARERLLSLRERLLGVLEALRLEHEVVRAAAAALAAHMDGLMRQIGRRLSQAGTYDRPAGTGEAAWRPPVATALDLIR